MSPRINWISKILVAFCYFRLYLGIKTISYGLLQRMARMNMNWNLKKLAYLFQVLTPCLQKSPENSMIGQLSRDVIGRLSVKAWCYWIWRLVMSLVRFDPSTRDFQIQWRDANENVAYKVNLRSISPYRNIVPTQLLCQIEANPPRIDFPGTIIQVQKEKLNFVFASIRCP